MCGSLTSIDIPDSVTTIGDEAFYKCESLTSVTLGNSVISIGDGAFSVCSNLTSVDILDSVTSIGDKAFCSCSSLTSVNIGDGVTTIGVNAFSYCNDLTSITIPDSVTTIGAHAFEYCTNMTSITIPDSVTVMGEWVFNNCTNLTDIYCEAASQPEGWSIDWYCGGDATVHWGYTGDNSGDNSPQQTVVDSQGVTYTLSDNGTYYIVDDFDGSVTEVDIPAEIYGLLVTAIDNHAFSDCFDLTNVTIPDSVTSIGDLAFLYCMSLTSVTLPNRITTIGEGVFHSCASLTSIDIPDSVTTIGDEAFYKCESLTSVTLGDNITSIGGEAFYWCFGLTDIYCEAESQPKGWDAKWLDGCNATVHWGYDPAQDAKEQLDAVVSDAEALDETEFTSEQWKDIQAALAFAKAYDATDKSIEDIQSVAEVLNEIIAGTPLVKGDADRSGGVDQFDYLMVKRGYFDTYTLYTGDMLRADIDKSGEIDQFDYLCIKRAYFGTYTIQ